MALFKIVNNSVWQVLHFLSILAHFDTPVTGLVTSVSGVATIAIIVSPIFNEALWPPDHPRDTDNDGILMICVLQGLFGSGSNVCISFWFLRLQNQPSSMTKVTYDTSGGIVLYQSEAVPAAISV